VGYAFLSYARADQEYITRLAVEARRRGIDVWFDTNLVSGDRWADVIEAKVRGCTAFAPLITAASRRSDWCQRELLLADRLGKPLLPLVLHGTDVPMLLIDRQYEEVSGTEPPSGRWFTTLGEAAESPGATAPDDFLDAWRAAQEIAIIVGPQGRFVKRIEYLAQVDMRLEASEPLPDDLAEAMREHLTRLAGTRIYGDRAQGLLRRLDERRAFPTGNREWL
jgi:hypothetical protein